MDLAKTQFLSLFTKAITTALGIVQSVIVIRILSPAEFGLVGLVMSVGGVIGVSQHLGVVDGAIREIAVLKNKREIGKVFWVSHLVRQLVTIPLSVGLLLLAGVIATNVYGRPEIATLLQIFSAVLVLQGMQDVLGATLTGMKKFVSLYVVQVVTAAINVAVFAYLTWYFGITGFFIAIIATTSIMVVLYVWVVAKNLGKDLVLPVWSEVRRYAGRVMRIGAYMYLARIFFIVWQRLPILMLGGVLAADELGYLNVSQTFGSKLTIIAMALSEVNLSWMSSLYATKKNEFREVVTRNMQRVLVLMMMIALVLLFFTPEILKYVIGAEYLPAQPLILIMTLGFFLYALTDIGTSSVFVPADQPRLRAYAYGLMMTVTAVVIGGLLLFKPDSFLAAVAVLIGAALSYITMVVIAKRSFGVTLLNGQLFILLLALVVSVGWLFMEPGLVYRVAVFVGLMFYILREARHSKLLPSLKILGIPNKGEGKEAKIICFAGAMYDQQYWTNRQHIMSRVSQKYPVLYVEPRLWIIRYILNNWNKPQRVWRYIKRLAWYEKKHDGLYIKAQGNLIPGSREVKVIAWFNHAINKWWVLLIAKLLGFTPDSSIMWLYDTEAAQYLPEFNKSKVIYDCVDDHAAQAGPDRNAKRVEEEEKAILDRADLVTVTSKKLLEEKRARNKNTHLVLNAGDVDLFVNEPTKNMPDELKSIKRPIVGLVGALDYYKIDIELLTEVARTKPNWSVVLIGRPVVDKNSSELKGLIDLPNVYLLGAKERRDVPTYVVNFDVCFIPYRNSRYNEASFPLKFWEFMATGKPIVVAGLPELKEYESLIGYAKSVNECIEKIEAALNNPEIRREERMKLAKEHSWQKRTNKILKLLCLD